jgi:hypothetical protein
VGAVTVNLGDGGTDWAALLLQTGAVILGVVAGGWLNLLQADRRATQ